MTYTKHEIIHRLRESSADMAQFYKKEFVNYGGKTSDTKEPYTEVIAQWLLEHLELLDQIPTITRASTYSVPGHDGVPDHADSNREEELIAMAMKRQGVLPGLGAVLDYQVPLKNRQADKAGKIDLLVYDGSTLRLMELKRPDSKETMLRCVLEGYTYLKTVDKEKLLADFGLPAGTVIQASPLVFFDGEQRKEMEKDSPHLKKLMEILHCKPFYIEGVMNQYRIRED